jgi:probable rRNA maturation factor
MIVECLIEDPRWRAAGLSRLARAAGRALAAELGLGRARLGYCLLGCDDARIAALNADHRGKARPTNVLSWPSAERGAAVPGACPIRPAPDPTGEAVELGDVALAFETCAAEAEAQGKPLGHHASHLIVHGILHLLGYDHETDADAALMEGIETRTLARLGIPDPY